MTEDTPRKKFNEHARGIKKWQGLEAISRQHSNFQNPTGQSEARASLKSRYAEKYGVPVESIEGIEPWTLRDDVSADSASARVDALSYFTDNQDEIIEGIPKTRLEEHVYDDFADLGILPVAEGRMEEHAKRHNAYLAARQLVGRFASGDQKAGDEEVLLGLAASQLRKEEAERLEEEGYDPENDSQVYALGMQAAGQRAYAVKDRAQLVEIGSKRAESLKAEFKKGFDKDYTPADYARDTLAHYAGEEPEKVAQIIAGL